MFILLNLEIGASFSGARGTEFNSGIPCATCEHVKESLPQSRCMADIHRGLYYVKFVCLDQCAEGRRIFETKVLCLALPETGTAELV